MKRVTLAAAICTFVLVTTGNAGDKLHRVLAEELLGLMDVQKTIEKSFEMMKQMVPSQLKQMGVSGNGASEETLKEMQKMMDIIMEEMSWKKMKDDYIDIYADTFTEKEIKGFIKFYKSPIGRKLIEKQPEIMRKSMQLSQKQMGELMPKIQELIKEMKK